MADLDRFTKDAAKDFANNEAEVRGFKVGSEQWKRAFKEYCEFAEGTMSVGRNPRSHRYKVVTNAYPEVFGAEGFAGRVKLGGDLKENQFRILSSVMNLLKMFEAGIMETKNTTSGKAQGKIPNSEMSDLQFPNKEEFSNDDEYKAALHDVVFNWFVRDLISNCILESLSMFFRLTKKDVEDIMAAVNIEAELGEMKNVMKDGREEFIKRLKAQVQYKVEALNYKKMVLG